MSAPPSEPSGLAFKAYEIEELVDVYFFRRCGILVARAARVIGLSPNAVSVLAALIGGVGGVMLGSDRLALAGVACLFLHGIFDSADGQLARMTGQTSELGRLLDGLAGYVTHVAAYLAIVFATVARGGGWAIAGWALLAGVATAIHAQMYDYHRTTYAAVVVKGVPSASPATLATRRLPPLVALYETYQRRIAGLHPEVEAVIASRASNGRVREGDRLHYRARFYRLVRGWNLFGDNVRRFAFAALALLDRLDLIFLVIVLPLNVVFAVMWVWQRHSDRQYLDDVTASPSTGEAAVTGQETAATSTKALIVVSEPVAHQRFCGRTLVERHQHHLRRAGIVSIESVAAAQLENRLQAEAAATRVVIVTAERVFDPRLYVAVARCRESTRMTDRGTDVGLRLWTRLGAAAGELDVAALDPYDRSLRRTLLPYWRVVSGRSDRAAVTRLLVEASGKGHQDLPAMLINAPVEKAAIRLLANTAITPNQITLVCNLLAYMVAGLLASGHLLAGALGGMVVGVIDGMDGRQARVQLRTSRLGRLEHVLDKIYEVLWLIALAYALSDQFAERRVIIMAVLWVAAYVADTVAYDVVKWRTGATLDEASRLDGWIRAVAGRRNVYTCMLLIGVLLDWPDRAFVGIVAWAVLTAVVHGVRAATVVSGRGRRVLV